MFTTGTKPSPPANNESTFAVAEALRFVLLRPWLAPKKNEKGKARMELVWMREKVAWTKENDPKNAELLQFCWKEADHAP